MEKYETLSMKITQGQLMAEERCRKTLARFPWSPYLSECGRALIFWRAIKRKVRKFRSKEEIKNVAYKYNIPQLLKDPKLPEKEIPIAKSTLKKAQNNAEDLRDLFLEEQAKMYAELKECTPQKAIIQIRQKERVGRTFRKLKHFMSSEETAR